jgi:6-phosphogluconolactonase
MRHTIHVSDDPVAVLAERLVDLLGRASHTCVALSGGSTPRPLYRLLGGEFRSRIHWDRVTLFQIDERILPPDHPDSNWRAIQEDLVSKVPGLTAYPMQPTLEHAADDYEARLRNALPEEKGGVPVLDLALLGMGADGHTASLFPGTPALDVQDRLVVESQGPPPHTRRLTLTLPVLRAAARRWFLVTGADKAPAFRHAQSAQVPAGLVGDSEWFVDKAVVA